MFGLAFVVIVVPFFLVEREDGKCVFEFVQGKKGKKTNHEKLTASLFFFWSQKA